MALDVPPVYDLARLTSIIAEEALGGRYFWYTTDFGEVEGYQKPPISIRPGKTLNTDHLVFIAMGRHKVCVDCYGDVGRYSGHPIEEKLAAIVADALMTYREREEPAYLEPEPWDLPDTLIGWKIA